MATDRVLIVGARGQLGTALAKIFSTGYEVIALGREELDITQKEAVLEKISALQPRLVINCAAYNNVELAGEEIAQALAINAIGPANLASAARLVPARFVHISTDYVFGDEKQSYAEQDCPRPTNVYGVSKLSGEQLVSVIYPESLIIRTSWLFGSSPDPNSHNFVATMLRLAKERSVVPVVNDQYGTPTYVVDLAGKIRELFERNVAPGIYHVTNSGSCSRFELAQKIFALVGAAVTVKPQSTAKSGTKVRRPKYSVLANTRLAEAGIKPLRHWSEALSAYLEVR